MRLPPITCSLFVSDGYRKFCARARSVGLARQARKWYVNYTPVFGLQGADEPARCARENRHRRWEKTDRRQINEVI
jgi:hypothetical protein